MSNQRIDLSNLQLEMPTTSFAAEHLLPKKRPVEENEQAGPDEFEIRRRAFFGGQLAESS